MKNYFIKFSYDTYEGRAFYETNIKALSRQDTFDLAIDEFNSSIRLESASENGNLYYENMDF